MTRVGADLYTLISEGYFNRQDQSYLEEARQNPRHTFAQIKRNEGMEAAEKWFTKWSRSYTELAPSLVQIALGVRALAEIHPESVLDITARRPETRGALGESGCRRFVAFNPAAPGCGCAQPAFSSVFSPWGRFPLRAIVLETALRSKKFAQVTLVFPTWSGNYQSPPPPASALAFVCIQSNGYETSSLYQPTEDQAATTSADDYLKYLLGMTPDLEIPSTELSSGAESVLGFPGAHEYLVSMVPHVGKYLIELAGALAPGHGHLTS